MKIFQKSFLAKYLTVTMLALGSSSAFSQVSISMDIAPPPLPVFAQPACPNDGYIWTPGYWAYGDNAYSWVPGAWVQPPQIGEFWTPPYWEWNGNAFAFYSGYWGPNVGYYGGINYGYGYGGNGYGGGRWQGGHFSYNTAVNNVKSINIHNTYVDRTVINNNASKVSYNGGKGGVQAQPTAQERQFSDERHRQSSSVQQPETSIPSQAPTQEKTESQQEPAQAQQPQHPQEQVQQKQEVHPSQQIPQQTHDKETAAQPANPSAKDGNNAPNH